MAELEIEIDGKWVKVDWDNPNPPSEQHIREIVAAYRANPPAAPSRPMGTGRIGPTGTRMSPKPLQGKLNDEIPPMNPMAGFGVQDQVTKQPVDPKAIMEANKRASLDAIQKAGSVFGVKAAGTPKSKVPSPSEALGLPDPSYKAPHVKPPAKKDPLKPQSLVKEFQEREAARKPILDAARRETRNQVRQKIKTREEFDATNVIASGKLDIPAGAKDRSFDWVKLKDGYRAKVGNEVVTAKNLQDLRTVIQKSINTITPDKLARAEEEVSAYIDFQRTGQVDPKRQAKMQKEAKAAFVKKYGFDPEKEPVRAQQIYAQEFMDSVAEFTRPVVKPVGEAISYSFLPYAIARGLEKIPEGTGGEVVNSLVAGALSAPNEIGAELNVLGAAAQGKANIGDVAGAVTNILFNTGVFDPLDAIRFVRGAKVFKEPKKFLDAVDNLSLEPNQKAAVKEFITQNPDLTLKGFREDGKPIFSVKAEVKAEAPKPVAKIEPPQVETPKTEPPRVEPAPKKPVEPTESSKGQTIGLANQVEFRMAEAGRIEPVDPGQGRKWGVAQQEGKKAVETNEINPYDLADDLEANPRPISYKEVGALTEGARRLEVEVNRLSDKLAKLKPGREFEEVFEQLEKSRAELNDFLRKAQRGKTELSDAFRALQEGSELDTGNLAQVIKRREARTGQGVSLAEQERLRKEVKALQDEVKKVVPDYDPAKETVEQALRRRQPDMSVDRAKAEIVLNNMSRRMRAKSPEQLRQARKAAATRLGTKIAQAGSQLGAGPGQLFSNLRQAAPEIVEDLKIIVRTLAEEFQIRVLDKKLFDMVRDEVPGMEITDDEITKALAGVYDEIAERRPSFYEKLTKQAKRKELEGLTDAKERLAEAEKRMKEWEAKPDQIDADEVRANRARLNEIKKRMREWEAQEAKAKSIEEKRAVRADRKRLREIEKELQKTESRLDKLADLEEQIATGGIWESVPKVKKLTKQQEALDLQIQLRQENIRQLVNERDMTKAERAVRFATSTLRAATLGSDVGVLARQGMRAWTKPLIAIRNTGQALKAMLSDENLLRFQNELRNREIDGRLAEPIRRKMNLSRTTHFAEQEEFSLGRLFRWFGQLGGHAPGAIGEFLKNIPGALDRFQSAFINGVRTDFFDYGIRRGWSDAELADRAAYINSVFGRSNKNAGKLAEVLLTSPRYERSRWETLYRVVRDPIKYAGSGFKDKSAQEAVKEMAVMTAEVMAIIKLAELAGFNTPLNPLDKEFGVMRRGDETWDISAGLGPRFRDIMRLVGQFFNPEGRETVVTVTGRAVTRAVSPGVRIPVDAGYMQAQRAKGVDETKIKSLFSGFEPDPAEKGFQSLTPLLWRNVGEAIQEQGLLNGLAVFAKEFVGTSVNRYPSRKADAAGRPFSPVVPEGDKKYIQELDRLGIEGKLADKEANETDQSWLKRSREAGDAALKAAKTLIDSPAYKDWTKTQKLNMLKLRMSQAKSAYHKPTNAAKAAAKQKKEKETIEREKAAGVR